MRAPLDGSELNEKFNSEFVTRTLGILNEKIYYALLDGVA